MANKEYSLALLKEKEHLKKILYSQEYISGLEKQA